MLHSILSTLALSELAPLMRGTLAVTIYAVASWGLTYALDRLASRLLDFERPER